MSRSRVYLEERLAKIVRTVNLKSRVTVEELSAAFGVSPTTIRSDLRELERRSLIVRTHGGALSLRAGTARPVESQDPSYANRLTQNQEAKAAIGREAAQLLHPNDSILLDDGSTTLEFARRLPEDLPLTVVTNGLDICRALAGRPAVNVVGTGGSLNRTDMSFLGPAACESVERYYADKAMLGVSGLSVAHGISAPTEEKANLKRAMINRCRQFIVLADSTKLGRLSFVWVCSIEAVHTLVTDELADTAAVQRLEQLGVKVIVARMERSGAGFRGNAAPSS